MLEMFPLFLLSNTAATDYIVSPWNVASATERKNFLWYLILRNLNSHRASICHIGQHRSRAMPIAKNILLRRPLCNNNMVTWKSSSKWLSDLLQITTKWEKNKDLNPENKDHGTWSHHFMGNRWGNSGNSVRLYFYGLQNHYRWWLQPWNQKMLTPWKESYDQPR